MMETFLIVGLGNPGREFRGTRHNVGFMLLDRLTVKFHARFTRLQSKALVASTNFQERRIILAKPQTFMNLSGESVRGFLDWHKYSVLDMLVVHDDIDLEFGQVRLREKGRSGGHNGVQSIIDQVGTDIFYRLKLGVGRPPVGRDPADYVLSRFSAEEEKKVPDMIASAVRKIEEFVKKR